MHGRCLRHYKAPSEAQTPAAGGSDSKGGTEAKGGTGPNGGTVESGKLDGLATIMNYIFMYRDEEG